MLHVWCEIESQHSYDHNTHTYTYPYPIQHSHKHCSIINRRSLRSVYRSFCAVACRCVRVCCVRLRSNCARNSAHVADVIHRYLPDCFAGRTQYKTYRCHIAVDFLAANTHGCCLPGKMCDMSGHINCATVQTMATQRRLQITVCQRNRTVVVFFSKSPIEYHTHMRHRHRRQQQKQQCRLC